MSVEQVLRRIDADNARAFAGAVRNLVEALLVEARRGEELRTPGVRDYRTAELSRETPPGGWIGREELDRTARALTEALTAEKWTEGFVTAVRFVAALAG